MSKPWFRLYSEFATDPVVQSLGFEDQRHYVVLLCLKCSGVLDRKLSPQNRERIITRTIGLDQASSDEAKSRMIDVGLIDKNWQPTAWDKRQYISDNSTDRVRKHRKTKDDGNVSETLRNRSRNGPDTETDTEKESTKEKAGAKAPVSPKKVNGFSPPTVEEVQSYCKSRGNGVNPTKYHDFYASKGWMVGKSKMKDWKASVRTWEDDKKAEPKVEKFI